MLPHPREPEVVRGLRPASRLAATEPLFIFIAFKASHSENETKNLSKITSSYAVNLFSSYKMWHAHAYKHISKF